MKRARCLLWLSAAVLAAPAIASAGLLDKLNEATKKMSEASQQAPQRNQQSQGGQGQYGGGGSLSAALGATTVNRDFPECMAQTAGAHEKLTAQVLQRKLNLSKNLSPQQRSDIEQDIRWLNGKGAGERSPAPDPKNPQRYLLVLTDEEQQEINSATNRFNAEAHERCEAQYGGMTQFADPAGRRLTPTVDTNVLLPDLLHAAPPVAAQPEARAAGPSAQEVGERCIGQLQGLRWQLIAERLEAKLAAGNLPARERKAWEEDIAAMRAAQQSNAQTAQSPDPKNSMRYLMRLTPQEQTALAQEQAARSQRIMADCTGGTAARPAEASNRASELAAMHARRREERTAPKTVNTGATNGEARAWLDAHPWRGAEAVAAYSGGGATKADYLSRSGVTDCYERQKGFRAKQTADRLTAKRGSASAQERQELEAWITAWRVAEQARTDEPTPPKSSDPSGYLRFLTQADQQELNMAYSALSNKVRDECNAIDHMGTGGGKR